MLRPATPLSILLFISFVLLLISVLSTPVIKGIPIARYQDVNFGVFGYCQDDGSCSRFKVGYTTDSLFQDQQTDFNLPSSARHSLSSLLIVHPVAALCNLIVLGLAIAAHFHSPSHSARYLLGLLILLLPTLLVTLLAFLVDILLFVPHVQWGGWIVLASTILITASGVVTCAMRRTLVSRKARKKRIAENAEMSGENFYTRQEQESKMATIPTFSTESKTPLVNGGPGADNLPPFAAYEVNRNSEDRQQSRQSVQNSSMTAVSPTQAADRYYANSSRSNSRPPPGESGIPLAPMNTQGAGGPYRPAPEDRGPAPYPPSAYGMRGNHGPSRARGGSQRGGFAPRAGFGPRGPPPQGYGRGGFNPDMRGGYGGRGRAAYRGAPMTAGAMMTGAIGNRGPPPPGYPPHDGDVSPEQYGPRQGFPPASQPGTLPYSRPEGDGFEPVSPSRYTTTNENTTNYVAYGQQAQSPTKAASFHSRGQSPAGMRRPPSPPPEMPLIGQAVQMNQSNGRLSGTDPNIYSADSRHQQSPVGSSHEERSADYIPPRTQWNKNVPQVGALAHDAVTMEPQSKGRPRGGSNASGSYYEDVNPRFAENADVISALPPRGGNPQQQQQLPQPFQNSQNPSPEAGVTPLPHSTSYEELPRGARSPAESETSHFTSVSQRGVNPNWRPGYGGEFNSFGPRRPQQAQQARHDMLLANNPDFELVPPSGRFNVGGGRGGFRGLMGGSGVSRLPPPSALGGMGGDSPYGPTTMREI